MRYHFFTLVELPQRIQTFNKQPIYLLRFFLFNTSLLTIDGNKFSYISPAEKNIEIFIYQKAIDRGGAGGWSWGAEWNGGRSPEWNVATQRRLTA